MRVRPFRRVPQHKGSRAWKWHQQESDEFEPFESRLRKGLWCPPRLRGRDASVIEEVNDWYFAMLHDRQRNDFYWSALGRLVKGKRVVDIGAGCGLLSLMAARLGAESVLAVEASREMCTLARLNLQRNGLADTVRVVNSWSCDVALPPQERADVVVSETLGTLLLGECAHLHLSDARKRLAKPDAVVVPACGTQFARLVMSPSLASLSAAPPPEACHGFDLSATNALQDTAGLYFTKDRGVRLSSLTDLTAMSQSIPLFSAEFGVTEPHDIPRSMTFQVEAKHSGVVHAVVTTWEAEAPGGGGPVLSTDYESTRGQPWGFFRDMQWGQGIQLVEDFDAAPRLASRGAAPPPVPFQVVEGERLALTVRLSHPDRMSIQFRLQRARDQ
uniref:Methyltransferase domain-containing protein n=1 Tax=Alexandrium catenella TaxID=2925 RepID=A0A7S1MD08_ALECA|mmetsp:Transcript_24060/g.65600  ORF Transcript_24060/g.65600 Transcript_24060/m.65600 type:complete len:387 (+) Transcript_24060:82-1242(+)